MTLLSISLKSFQPLSRFCSQQFGKKKMFQRSKTSKLSSKPQIGLLALPLRAVWGFFKGQTRTGSNKRTALNFQRPRFREMISSWKWQMRLFPIINLAQRSRSCMVRNYTCLSVTWRTLGIPWARFDSEWWMPACLFCWGTTWELTGSGWEFLTPGFTTNSTQTLF